MIQIKQAVKGILEFQKDFNTGGEPIECYKACSNCKEEKSSVYIILSAQPLSNIIIKKKKLNPG